MVLVNQRAERGVGSGVVDQDVQAAEPLHRQLDAALRRLLVDGVGGHADRVAGDLSRGCVRRLLLAGGQYHIGAGCGEPLRDREADAARGAGDDRGAAGEMLLSHCPSPFRMRW